MFNILKTANLIFRSTPLLCGLWLAAILVLLPLSARAQCTKWDLGTELTIRRGSSAPVRLTLTQKGTVITGRADEIKEQDGSVLVSAEFKGGFYGNRIHLQIDLPRAYLWNVYDATVQPSGKLEGETYIEGHPNLRQKWHSDEVLTCKARVAAPPPTPPFIVASQAIIPTPMHPFGIVPLSWDGGPDHPNVEVVLSIDNGVEIPAFSMEQGPQSPVWKQPKISIAVQLQRQHYYKFVLKEAEKTLATAAVVVP